MNRNVLYFFFILSMASGCVGFSDKLNVAVASNAQYAIKEIATEFEKEFNTKINIIPGSSGKLSALIKQGAPYDIFVSADILYPQDLYETGYATDQPEVYAYGKLAILSSNENTLPDIESFTDPRVNKIAIANPKLAPYGRLAVSALNHYGIYDEIKDKIVLGESISQCAQFINSGAAELGITSISVVTQDKTAVGRWKEMPEDSYIPIAQAMIMINRSQHEHSKAFYDFLLSDKATEILKAYGYKVDLSI